MDFSKLLSSNLLTAGLKLAAEVQADPELKASLSEFGKALGGFLEQSGFPVQLVQAVRKGKPPSAALLRAVLNQPDVRAWVKRYKPKR